MCVKLVICESYTKMHGHQNIKIILTSLTGDNTKVYFGRKTPFTCIKYQQKASHQFY